MTGMKNNQKTNAILNLKVYRFMTYKPILVWVFNRAYGPHTVTSIVCSIQPFHRMFLATNFFCVFCLGCLNDCDGWIMNRVHSCIAVGQTDWACAAHHLDSRDYCLRVCLCTVYAVCAAGEAVRMHIHSLISESLSARWYIFSHRHRLPTIVQMKTKDKEHTAAHYTIQ